MAFEGKNTRLWPRKKNLSQSFCREHNRRLLLCLEKVLKIDLKNKNPPRFWDGLCGEGTGRHIQFVSRNYRGD